MTCPSQYVRSSSVLWHSIYRGVLPNLTIITSPRFVFAGRRVELRRWARIKLKEVGRYDSRSKHLGHPLWISVNDRPRVAKCNLS